MNIICAECGCLVDCGVITEPCDKYPARCCTDLPVRSRNSN